MKPLACPLCGTRVDEVTRSLNAPMKVGPCGCELWGAPAVAVDRYLEARALPDGAARLARFGGRQGGRRLLEQIFTSAAEVEAAEAGLAELKHAGREMQPVLFGGAPEALDDLREAVHGWVVRGTPVPLPAGRRNPTVDAIRAARDGRRRR